MRGHKSSNGNGAPLSPRLNAWQRKRIGHFATISTAKMAAWAERLSRHYHLDAVRLPAEGVVQCAMARLCQAVAEGKLHPIKTLTDFHQAYRLNLRQFLVEETRREHARKSGGNATGDDGPTPAHRQVDAELDRIPAVTAPPDARLMEDERVEWVVSLLDRHDPPLGRPFLLRFQGASNHQIAAVLGEPISAIEKKFRKIRSILEPYLADLMA